MDLKLFVYLLVASIVFWGVIHLYTRSLIAKMQRALFNNDLDEFDTIYNSFLTKKLVSEAKILAIKLDFYLKSNNDSEIINLANEINNAIITKKDKNKMLMVIFQFFMGKASKKNCKLVLNVLKNVCNELEYHECKMAYDINLDDSFAYIEELDKQMQEADGQTKGMKAYLIAKQYGNKKDRNMQKKYLNIAKESLKGTSFEKVIQYELDKC